MSIFGENPLSKIVNGGIIPKSPTVKIIEKVLQTAVENITTNKSSTSPKKSAQYGDVIGVRRIGYKHFGVYLNDDCIIHYASPTGDFGKNICIHETTLKKFLDGADSYFVCKFPETYGKPSEIAIAALSISSFAVQWAKLFKLLKGMNYHLYSPSETVQRAKSRIGENKYSLIFNNCEHFAIWCKTGISESHQVNDILGELPTVMIRV
jgi:hypothetical protein